MTRRALRLLNNPAVLTEGPFLAEFDLQNALVHFPEVLPAEDLGLSTLVSLGWELDLGAGRMDQLAADRSGRLVIIEFKKGSENREARRVVAQLLDYGSALWETPYERLEAACQDNGTHTLLDGETLVEHVSRVLVGLGESPVDQEAFQNGVRTVLADGRFVFAYIARDLDSRTKRILTYVAEGAGLSVFAIEVDNFCGTNRSDTVLAPRVAYVPTAVIQESAAQANADPATEQLIELVEAIAAPAGYRTKRDAKGARWPGTGVGIFRTSTGLQVEVAAVRARMSDDAVNEVRNRLHAMAGKKLSEQWWYVPPKAVVDAWETGGRDVIATLFGSGPFHQENRSSHLD